MDELLNGIYMSGYALIGLAFMLLLFGMGFWLVLMAKRCEGNEAEETQYTALNKCFTLAGVLFVLGVVCVMAVPSLTVDNNRSTIWEQK